MRPMVAATVLCVGFFAAIVCRAAPPEAKPELALCPPLKPLEEPLNDRAKPLPVPKAFAMLIASGRERYAVATIYGGTVCVDTRAMTNVGAFTISTDRRFIEFDWTGYEADGHIVVDRTGAGQVFDTGASPISSPSGRRFAAVQQSEAAFGSLEGFAVWQIGVVGVRRLTYQEDIPRLADWRIDGWGSDTCIDLSGVPHERYSAGGKRIKRDRYVANAVGTGWVLTPSSSGCPKGGK